MNDDTTHARDKDGNHTDMSLAAIRQRHAERLTMLEKIFGKRRDTDAPKTDRETSQ